MLIVLLVIYQLSPQYHFQDEWALLCSPFLACIVFQNEGGELETGISKTSSKVVIVFIGSGLFFVAIFFFVFLLLQHPNYNAECNYGQPFVLVQII